MAEYRESRTPQSRGKKIKSVEILDGEDGGTVVLHHYHDDGMAYHKPKEYVFASDEGADLAQHLGKFTKIPVGQTSEGSGDV